MKAIMELYIPIYIFHLDIWNCVELVLFKVNFLYRNMHKIWYKMSI